MEDYELEDISIIAPTQAEMMVYETEGWRLLHINENGIYKYQRWKLRENARI